MSRTYCASFQPMNSPLSSRSLLPTRHAGCCHSYVYRAAKQLLSLPSHSYCEKGTVNPLWEAPADMVHRVRPAFGGASTHSFCPHV